jgi:DNA-binding response OmpR family regulator
VWLNGQELDPPLSVPQFRLLQILFEHEGQVVERQNLIQWIWGEEEAVGVSEQAFDALVRRLRDRLAMIDPSHGFIITVRGHGLRLDIPDEN